MYYATFNFASGTFPYRIVGVDSFPGWVNAVIVVVKQEGLASF
jgi:hypothetical protein